MLILQQRKLTTAYPSSEENPQAGIFLRCSGPEPFYEKTTSDRVILISFLAGPHIISYSNLVFILL